MNTNILIDAVRRCAIVWRDERSRSHYWIGDASLSRLTSLARRGPLVRRDGNEDTYALDLQNPNCLDTMEVVADRIQQIMADCELPGFVLGGAATQAVGKAITGLRLNVQWDCIPSQQPADCARLGVALKTALRCADAGIDGDAPTWIVLSGLRGVTL